MARRNLRFEHLLLSQSDDNHDPEVLSDFTNRLSFTLGRLSSELREGWKAREENHLLRHENAELRGALAHCIGTCERFLGATLTNHDSEDADLESARMALADGRRVLSKDPVRLLGVRT